jgi:uncharacterized protein YndB with AHSA1/START domain
MRNVLVFGLLPAAIAAGGDDDEVPLVHEAVLDAPVSEVWKVFTTSEGWKALGVAHAQVDFRVGGRILSHYDPNGRLGDEKTIENTILAFEPGRMLAFKATKPPAGFPFPREVLDRMWSVLALTDLGDGRTRISLRGYGYGSDDASRKMRAFFGQGNAWVLARLAQRFPKREADGRLAPIEVSAVVPAAPAEVFRSWTTAEGIRAFLGVEARVRLEPGGPFELEFDASAAAGRRGSEGCTVLSWLDGRMLSFTWNAPPKFAHCRERFTVVVVEVEAEGPRGTRVRLTHQGFAEGAAREPGHAEEWRQVRDYFSKAWPSVLAALRKHAEGGQAK